MQKAKEAKTVGILVGTLGAGKVFCASCTCTLQYDSVCMYNYAVRVLRYKSK